jgi:hypothetical protein
MNTTIKAAACSQDSAATYLKPQKNYPTSIIRIQGQFVRALLPSPISVLTRLGIHPKKMNPKGYWILSCPFHKEGKEKNPSLNLHQTKGNFRCHSCGAKGGDILAFFMVFTNTSFIEAARELGALEDFV